MPEADARLAHREDRTVLRLAPCRAWLPCIWITRTGLQIEPDGRVPIGHERLRVMVAASNMSSTISVQTATSSYSLANPKQAKYQQPCSRLALFESVRLCSRAFVCF